MTASRSVGVRELKAHVSRILHDVIDRGEAVDVTYRGRAVARIIPLAPPLPETDEAGTAWAELDRLAAEIAGRWPTGDTAVDAVREGRRSL